MISSPSAFTHRVYGVSFSVVNLLASASETSAFFLAISAIGHPYACAGPRILTKNVGQRLRTKKIERRQGVHLRITALAVLVLMAVVVMMAGVMRMFVLMTMIVLAVMQTLARPRTTRVFAEHQGFDRDRHGVRRHADTAEIDIVEIPQHDAVDDQKLAGNVAFVTKEMGERLRHVAVQHDVERQALGNPLCEPAPDALGEGGEPRIRRWTAPT